jgi:hypothetical protein
MKTILKIVDINETIDVEQLSPEELREIERARVGSSVFLNNKAQAYGIESIDTNVKFEIRTIYLFETIRLVKTSDTVKVARIFNEDNAKYYNQVGKVLEIIVPDLPPEKRRHRGNRFHFLVRAKLENGSIVVFFDTELELI